MMNCHVRFAAVFFVALLFNVSSAQLPARAADRALLVGVSNYPREQVGDLQLEGPKNDVALMLKTLREANFEDRNIIVLADSMGDTDADRPADGPPTRAAIMAALERLAREAAAGDQIVIMLSGHGSQAPITNPASLIHHPDGLNPIFLPIDIGKWNDTVGAVHNAIAGDEFGMALTAIRKKGAFVWVIVDACHSGTITRGAELGVAAKKISPFVLGVPAERLEASRKMAAAAAPRTRSGAQIRPPASAFASMDKAEGGYVAFFAAHPDELAIQRNLPKGYGGGEKRPHGVLVFYLVQALRTGRAQSYADLAQMVLAGYDQWGATAPSPLFEGDLRAGILGARSGGAKTYPAQVAGNSLILAAGVLDEVGEGTLVSLREAGDASAPPIAHARVVSASGSSSALEIVARGNVPAPSLKSLQEAGRLSARIEERGLALELRVAVPERRAGLSAREARAYEAIEALVKDGDALPAAIRLETGARAADVFLRIEHDRLWFAGADGEIVTNGRRQTTNISLHNMADVQAARSEIAKVLRGQFKVRNLIKAAETMGLGPAGQSLEVKAAIARSGPGPAAANAKAPDDRACGRPSLDKLPEGIIPLSGPSDLPALAHCDVVYFALRNTGKKVLDVTPLYIDGGGAIDYMGPPEGLRLLPGAPPRIIPITIVTWDSKRGEPFPIGLERLLFIAVEQENRASLPADFRYLSQPALTRSAATRGGSNALRTLLEEAAFGTGRTRSASAGAAIGAAGIAQYRWKVSAPE